MARAGEFDTAAERVDGSVRRLREVGDGMARAWESPGARRFHADFSNYVRQVAPLVEMFAGAAEALRTLARHAHEVGWRLRANEVRIANLGDEMLGLGRLLGDAGVADQVRSVESRRAGLADEVRYLENHCNDGYVWWAGACRACADTLRAVSVPLDIASALTLDIPVLTTLRVYTYAAALSGRPAAGVAWFVKLSAELGEAESPADIAVIFGAMSPARRRVLVRDYPELIGNLDGVPLQMRIDANRVRMETDYENAAAGSAEQKRLREMLASIDDPYGGRVPRQFLIYDTTADGRYAEVFGDITTADNVAVYLPGTGSALSSWRKDSDRGFWLWTEANDGFGERTAVVSYLGFDAPDGLDNAGFPEEAETARPLVVSFMAGLGLRAAQHVTLIGHSYGSTMTGFAMREGDMSIDDAVALGSPGMGVGSEDGLNLDGGRLYALKAPGEPVGWLEAFGEDPSSPGFGGVRLETNLRDSTVRIGGHGDYFAENVSDPLWDGIQDHLPVPEAVDDVVDAGQRAQDVLGGAVETGARNTVDKTLEIGGDVIETGGDIVEDIGEGLGDLGDNLNPFR